MKSCCSFIARFCICTWVFQTHLARILDASCMHFGHVPILPCIWAVPYIREHFKTSRSVLNRSLIGIYCLYFKRYCLFHSSNCIMFSYTEVILVRTSTLMRLRHSVCVTAKCLWKVHAVICDKESWTIWFDSLFFLFVCTSFCVAKPYFVCCFVP